MKTEWISQSEAARLAGVRKQSIANARGKRGWPIKKRGRQILLRKQDVEEYRQSRKPSEKPRAEGEMTMTSFGEALGISARIARRWLQEGRITGYTESEVERILAERKLTRPANAEPAQERSRTKDGTPEKGTVADLARDKEYWYMRRARAKALHDEGNSYDAEEVEQWARRIGQLLSARIQQLPQRLPAAIERALTEHQPGPGDERVAVLRSVLANWAQTTIEDLEKAVQLKAKRK